MSAASQNLRDHQEPADATGTMVNVSREALDETLAQHTELLRACSWAEAALAPFSNEPSEKSGINMIRVAISRARDD